MTSISIGIFYRAKKKLSGFQPGHKIDKTRVKSARNGQKVRKNTSKWLRNVFYDVRLAKNDIAIFGFLFLYKIPDFTTRLVPWPGDKNSPCFNFGLIFYSLQKKPYTVKNLWIETIKKQSQSRANIFKITKNSCSNVILMLFSQFLTMIFGHAENDAKFCVFSMVPGPKIKKTWFQSMSTNKNFEQIFGDFLSGGKKLSGFQPGHKIDKTRVKSARNGQKVRKNTSKWLRNVFYDVRLAKNDIAIFGFLFLYKIPDFTTRLVPWPGDKNSPFDKHLIALFLFCKNFNHVRNFIRKKKIFCIHPKSRQKFEILRKLRSVPKCQKYRP